MAAEIGPAGAPVKDAPSGVGDGLLAEPYRFEFFQAVRLLERIYTDRAPVGRFDDPQAEVVRFKAHHSLSFPASEIYDIKPPLETASGTTAADMTVTFMGLTGPMGTLPHHYTTLLIDPGTRNHVKALKEFLDIFNHRFISFFYRAWEKYQFPIAYERGDGDAFSQYLYSLIGLGTKGLQERFSFTDEVFLYYSGLLAQRPRSAAALESILQDYFELPVHVEQFTGEWFLMNPDTLTGLGTANHQLGVSAVLWERIFDPPARFRVVAGPLSYERFAEFLPNGTAYAHLVELTRFFAGDDMNFEVQPLLRREDVPWCALGTDPRIRLGWSMWLKEAEFETDVPQPLFGARISVSMGHEVANL